MLREALQEVRYRHQDVALQPVLYLVRVLNQQGKLLHSFSQHQGDTTIREHFLSRPALAMSIQT